MIDRWIEPPRYEEPQHRIIWTVELHADVNGKMLSFDDAPATDRREHADYAVGEPWRDEQPVTSAHAYDMATLDAGRRLSRDGVAQHRSRCALGDRAAVRGIGSVLLRGRLPSHALRRSVVGGPGRAFRGLRWHDVEGGSAAVAGRRAWLPSRGVRGSPRLRDQADISTPHTELAATPDRLVAFDGTTARVAFDGDIRDFFAADELYVLDASGTIWRSADLANWTRVAATDGLVARSLAILDGVLYVGTASSELYRR